MNVEASSDYSLAFVTYEGHVQRPELHFVCERKRKLFIRQESREVCQNLNTDVLLGGGKGGSLGCLIDGIRRIYSNSSYRLLWYSFYM